jgi:hypothetical protein
MNPQPPTLAMSNAPIAAGLSSVNPIPGARGTQAMASVETATRLSLTTFRDAIIGGAPLASLGVGQTEAEAPVFNQRDFQRVRR